MLDVTPDEFASLLALAAAAIFLAGVIAVGIWLRR
jgi:hypothetical protein